MHVHKLCLRQFSGRSHCSFLCHCFVLPTYYTCASHLKAGGIEYGLARAGRHSPPPLLPSLYGAGSVPSSTFERKRRRPTTTQRHKQGWGAGERFDRHRSALENIPQHVFSPSPSNSPFSSPLLQRSFLLCQNICGDPLLHLPPPPPQYSSVKEGSGSGADVL